jgi:hypothetical protein
MVSETTGLQRRNAAPWSFGKFRKELRRVRRRRTTSKVSKPAGLQEFLPRSMSEIAISIRGSSLKPATILSIAARVAGRPMIAIDSPDSSIFRIGASALEKMT